MSARFTPFRVLFGLVCVAPTACKLAKPPADPTARGCTKEAKVCPDGSTVAREEPDCQFEDCPSATEPKETATRDGLSPDPAPDGVEGTTNPKPLGTFEGPKDPPG